METAALSGGFADAPVEAARAFRAALDAMARPGRIVTVSGATPPAPLSPAAGALLLTLADADAPVALVGAHDCDAVRRWLAFHSGAAIRPAEDAALAVGRWGALAPLTAYRAGTPDYPDRSATLIVEMDALAATGARLTGPGIAAEARLSLPEIDAFAANRALFPRGLDFFFTAGDRLAALPRSTRVEAG
jgi:alpha-D-ribose 1-methylphosphonate 5-triphosphate synthase subunit PhnH